MMSSNNKRPIIILVIVLVVVALFLYSQKKQSGVNPASPEETAQDLPSMPPQDLPPPSS